MEKQAVDASDPRSVMGDGEGPQPSKPDAIPRSQLIALVAGPLAALIIHLLPAPEGMEPTAWNLVALTAWMVIWWLGEAIPIPATALLPIAMMPILGIETIGNVTANYGYHLIFLFLGGFVLAGAMQRWGLHRRLALHIVNMVGTSPGGIVAGFMLATAFLSMWISNTATTIMMFAVGLSIVDFIDSKVRDKAVVHNYGVGLMLAIAYAASIGGVGTLIGTPPNALLAGTLADKYGVEIDFFTWMKIGMPVVIVMLPIAWLLLTKVLFPARGLRLENAGEIIKQEIRDLGRMSRGEIVVMIVFLGAAFCWVTRDWLGLPVNDSGIAIIAALLLFAIPVSAEKGQYAIDWTLAKDIPWGILLLFGGGLALAGAFKSTGLAEYIGESVAAFEGVSIWVLVAITAVCIVYLTEITSNTASTATFLPILAAVATGLGENVLWLTVPVALGASMAFMMPVATPPNAIVFSYDKMKLGDMVRAGFWLNIIAIIVVFGAMYLLAGAVFGISK